MNKLNRLNRLTDKLLKNKQKAIVAFVTAGYPSIKDTVKIVNTLDKAGCDVIELGVPFSDPIADGPTIQYSSSEALKKKVNLDEILKAVSIIRQSSNIPIVLMSYLNPVMARGLEKTMRDSKKSGVDGFIIPDLIPEGSEKIIKFSKKYGLSNIFLVAPNTPNKRMKFIDSYTDGFMYIVSLTGVTGKRKTLSGDLKSFLKRTKMNIKHPRFLGFGISGPKQVKSLKNYADGFIAGSALIDIIRNNKNYHTKLYSFISGLKKASERR